jgi:hypothetical protein
MHIESSSFMNRFHSHCPSRAVSDESKDVKGTETMELSDI